jgi:hypothetical protein
VYYAAGNDACGWRETNGDLTKIIVTAIKARSAPVHFCYIKKDAAIKHGHLIEAKKAATQACTLPRTDASLLTPPLTSTRVMDPSIKLFDVPKVSANIPDDRIQHDLSSVPHPKRLDFPESHRGRDKLAALRIAIARR